MPNVSNVYIPQSIDYPGLELNIDRERASKDLVQLAFRARPDLASLNERLTAAKQYA